MLNPVNGLSGMVLVFVLSMQKIILAAETGLSALVVQFPAYLKVDLGLDPFMVGSVGSVFALFCLVGNLFGGAIFDKLGVTKGLIVAFLLAGMSRLCLIFAKQIPQLAFGFAVLKGLSVFAFVAICYLSLILTSINIKKLNDDVNKDLENSQFNKVM